MADDHFKDTVRLSNAFSLFPGENLVIQQQDKQ